MIPQAIAIVAAILFIVHMVAGKINRGIEKEIQDEQQAGEQLDEGGR